MLTAAIIAVNVVGYLWALRYVLRVNYESEQARGWDGEDLAMALTLGVIGGFFWPFVMGYALIRSLDPDPRVITRRIAGESRRAKAERLKREAEEREHHIAKLERQLGIGDDR
jgi:hypothetical protein